MKKNCEKKKTETENYQQNQLLFKETGNTHTNFGIKQKNCKKAEKIRLYGKNY